MFSINDTFIIFVVSFLVFVYLLNKFFIRPVGQTIDKRNRMIDEQQQATAELWKEAAGLIAKQEAELANARERAHAILKETEKSIQAQRENVLSELRQQGEARVARSAESLSNAREECLDGLPEDVGEMADTIVRKVLGDDSISTGDGGSGPPATGGPVPRSPGSPPGKSSETRKQEGSP